MFSVSAYKRPRSVCDSDNRFGKHMLGSCALCCLVILPFAPMLALAAFCINHVDLKRCKEVQFQKQTFKINSEKRNYHNTRKKLQKIYSFRTYFK